MPLDPELLRRPLALIIAVSWGWILSGSAARAKSAYEDFLTLRKHADADIPVLRQARAEYARLQ